MRRVTNLIQSINIKTEEKKTKNKTWNLKGVLMENRIPLHQRGSELSTSWSKAHLLMGQSY